ncbi:MAG: SDR family NAD(P)-dependent oxidoreductase [Chloroflexota bacterium]|nr:SDR family NAD(P)-dependent oxidoreductase [Chloroflexota bacterium]MDE2885369.1 SDR family NAD(P)-dependent oxidoreductase [Chloroflexota bacterium]
MNILVTGGAGFIGSHLVDRLVADGHRVAVVDVLATGTRANLNPQAALYEIDIRSPALAAAFEAAQPVAVYHVAAHASVSESVRDPMHDAEVNVLGTLNVLQQCAAYGVGRVVFISTGGALYGEPEFLPPDEGHPVLPLSPYGASKAAAETYVRTLCPLSGIRYTILRPGNVYGPRQDPFGEAGVVAIFANAMLRGERPTIFGDGSHERDYVYVDDVVQANVLALAQEEDGVYNIGTGEGTTVSQVFDALAGATDYDGAPEHAAERPGDVHRIYLDVRRAEQRLGWRASVSLEEGILRTVNAMREVEEHAE